MGDGASATPNVPGAVAPIELQSWVVAHLRELRTETISLGSWHSIVKHVSGVEICPEMTPQASSILYGYANFRFADSPEAFCGCYSICILVYGANLS
jgi:hypothetical protein